MIVDKNLIFSYSQYIDILHILKENNYEFIKIVDKTPVLTNKRFTKKVLLRHDADISPIGALKFGEIEAHLNITANYFFQLNAGGYQMLSPWCIDICRKLQMLGHVVGLHVDSNLFSEDEDKIMTTINWIRANIFPIDYAVSFHKPGKSVLGRKYTGFESTYSNDWFIPDFYVSDARCDAHYYEKLMSLINNNASYIQILFHPCWWEGTTNMLEIWERIKKRQLASTAKYMFDNFPKVFGNIITEEETCIK